MAVVDPQLDDLRRMIRSHVIKLLVLCVANLLLLVGASLFTWTPGFFAEWVGIGDASNIWTWLGHDRSEDWMTRNLNWIIAALAFVSFATTVFATVTETIQLRRQLKEEMTKSALIAIWLAFTTPNTKH